MHRRGQTLAETLVVLAILLTVTASALSVTAWRRPGAGGTTGRDFAALVDRGRALASTTGDGATIVIGPAVCSTAPAVPGSSQACLYSHRPIGAPIPTQAVATIDLPADVTIATLGSPPYGIFISPSGYVGAATWSPGQGALSAEPACTTTLALSFQGGTSQGLLDCTTATFTYPAPTSSPGTN